MNKIEDRCEVCEPRLLNTPVVRQTIAQEGTLLGSEKIATVGFRCQHFPELTAFLQGRNTRPLYPFGWPLRLFRVALARSRHLRGILRRCRRLARGVNRWAGRCDHGFDWWAHRLDFR